MSSFNPVIALGRGLEVLRVINEERRATVGSIHRATGLDKATIVRMLETLMHEDYVMREQDEAVYSPTGRVLLLSQGYEHHLWVGKIAEPIMQDIRKQIGWPSDIAVFDRDAMVVAETTREPSSMMISRSPGFRFPVLTTSMGRAYLAFCPAEEQARIIARLAAKPLHWNDLARTPKKLQKMLTETRERGFAVMDPRYCEQVYEGNITAIGVPVMDEDKVYASINVMMLRNVIQAEDAIEQFAEPLQEAAARIAKALSQKSGERP